MHTPLLRLGLAASLAVVLLGALPVLSRSTSPLTTRPCAIEGSKAVATCDSLTVYEHRAWKSGRSISIHFIVIKAKRPSKSAIAFNPSGPGASATEEAPGFVGDPFGFLRDRHQGDGSRLGRAS